MPRGGYRENAGRKSGWNHPETQVIRVPKAFAEQLMEIARKLDGKELLESVSDSENETVSDSKDKALIEAIEQTVFKWRKKCNNAPSKSSYWLKVNQMTEELEKVLQGKFDTDKSVQISLEPLSDVINENLDLVTNSKKVDIATQNPDTENVKINLPELRPLAAKELIPRLKISSKPFYEHRNRGEFHFAEWSKQRDPDQVGWQYHGDEKKYYPILDGL